MLELKNRHEHTLYEGRNEHTLYEGKKKMNKHN